MKHLVLLFTLLVLFACNDGKQSEYVAGNDIAMLSVDPEHPGKALLEKHCYACHNPTTAHENRIAPPMFAIKKHYLRNEVTKEEFTKQFVDWTSGPSADKAKMPGAVEKFGVMPYQEFDTESVKLIAEYLYLTELDTPECCQENMKMKSKRLGGEGGEGRGMMQGKGKGYGMHGEGGCKGDGNCCGGGKKI